MRSGWAAVLIATSVLAGCRVEDPLDIASSAGFTKGAEPPAVAAEAAADAGEVGDAPVAAAGPMLAYSHRYTIQAPGRALQPVLRRHEQACVKAGPSVCQVLRADIQEAGRDTASGVLILRATPAWLTAFRGGLEADLKGDGASIVEASTSTEDLTRSIVDTEAHLRAKRALRGRLEQLLASRPGKLGELLEVERELARVQGEIDSAESQLAVMRTRVATSELTLAYRSAAVLAPQDAWRPLGDALGDVGYLVSGTLAALIRLVAVILPLALILGVPAWLVLRARRRSARRREPQEGLD